MTLPKATDGPTHLRTGIRPRGILSRNQVRQVDRWAIEALGIPGVVLMENAGAAVARRLLELGCCGPVTILCGPGNNGGDGLVVARHLRVHEVVVRVVALAPWERFQGDARMNLEPLQRWADPGLELAAPKPQEELDFERFRPWLHEAQWVVDAVLGTGATGPLRSPIGRWIRESNTSQAKRLAVDLPTGLDADTGELDPDAFRANETVTLVAEKPGLRVPGVEPWVGRITVVDIGVPLYADAPWWPAC